MHSILNMVTKQVWAQTKEQVYRSSVRLFHPQAITTLHQCFLDYCLLLLKLFWTRPEARKLSDVRHRLLGSGQWRWLNSRWRQQWSCSQWQLHFAKIHCCQESWVGNEFVELFGGLSHDFFGHPQLLWVLTLFSWFALYPCTSHQRLLSSALHRTPPDPELLDWLHFYFYFACSFFSSLSSSTAACFLLVLEAGCLSAFDGVGTGLSSTLVFMLAKGKHFLVVLGVDCWLVITLGVSARERFNDLKMNSFSSTVKAFWEPVVCRHICEMN